MEINILPWLHQVINASNWYKNVKYIGWYFMGRKVFLINYFFLSLHFSIELNKGKYFLFISLPFLPNEINVNLFTSIGGSK
jgi:hypothetical protein